MAGIEQVGLWCAAHSSFVTKHVRYCDTKWTKAGQPNDCELVPCFVAEAVGVKSPATPTEQQCDALARFFHENYEEVAPQIGYETRPESAVPWGDVPTKNKWVMRVVSERVLSALFPDGAPDPLWPESDGASKQ